MGLKLGGGIRTGAQKVNVGCQQEQRTDIPGIGNGVRKGEWRER